MKVKAQTKPGLKLENARLLLANYDLEERVKALERENTFLSLFGIRR